MRYALKSGDTVNLGSIKLKVLQAPKMSAYFAQRGEQFGWVKCEVTEDPTGKYQPGHVSEFNGDFLR